MKKNFGKLMKVWSVVLAVVGFIAGIVFGASLYSTYHTWYGGGGGYIFLGILLGICLAISAISFYVIGSVYDDVRDIKRALNIGRPAPGQNYGASYRNVPPRNNYQQRPYNNMSQQATPQQQAGPQGQTVQQNGQTAAQSQTAQQATPQQQTGPQGQTVQQNGQAASQSQAAQQASDAAATAEETKAKDDSIDKGTIE